MPGIPAHEQRLGFWVVVASVAVFALATVWQAGERRFENCIRQAEVRYSGEDIEFAEFMRDARNLLQLATTSATRSCRAARGCLFDSMASGPETEHAADARFALKKLYVMQYAAAAQAPTEAKQLEALVTLSDRA